jgi:hypothetical protein
MLAFAPAGMTPVFCERMWYRGVTLEVAMVVVENGMFLPGSRNQDFDLKGYEVEWNRSGGNCITAYVSLLVNDKHCSRTCQTRDLPPLLEIKPDIVQEF